jgi:futalosine hydrolase
VSLLVVVATDTERTAVLRRLDAPRPQRIGPYAAVTAGQATVVVSGVGPAPAAAVTATALALGSYATVLNLGICGGFRGAAAIGDVVVATDLVAADVGTDSAEGFLGLAELGWAEESLPVPAALVQSAADRLRGAGLPVVTGPILTLSSMTGTDARADELAGRHGAVAEAMEGRGVADVATLHGVPVLEVRTVSNAVGRRDKAAWRFDLALDALSTAAAALLNEEAT